MNTIRCAPIVFGSFLTWRATLRHGRIERTDATDRCTPFAPTHRPLPSIGFSILIASFLLLAANLAAHAQSYTFTTLAGNASADGTGSNARFNNPEGVTVDSAGNVYVTDTSNDTIRKITPAGVVTTLAGLAGNFGSADGTGSSARFGNPFGVAVDSAGNVYVADISNYTIRKVTPAGVVTTLAGLVGIPGSADGTGSNARFNLLRGLAVDSAGNVYVADEGNDTIRKVTPAGVVTTLAGQAGIFGSADGTGSSARFLDPFGVAVDSGGNVYVADLGNSTIRKVTPAGVVTTLAGSAGSEGSADGTGSGARFNEPEGVTVDSAGNVYVADTSNVTIRKVTPAGAVTTLAGLAGNFGSADGTGPSARFLQPEGATVDSGGNVYVADSQNNTIRKVTPAGVVTTLAGSAPGTGSADGIGSSARFNVPVGVAVDSTSNFYVGDLFDNAIRKVARSISGQQTNWVVTTLAGNGGSGSADGTNSNARFSGPFGVAVDSAGNLYVADELNDTIRKVTPSISGQQTNWVVTTLAGSAGSTGSVDGTNSSAQFNFPAGVAVDSAGNVYVADTDNSTIRKVTPSISGQQTNWVVTTLAGAAGNFGSTDGTNSSARFGEPTGIAVDSAGNLYVTDSGNSTIRKVTPSISGQQTNWVVTTLAGSAGNFGSTDGTNSSARFGELNDFFVTEALAVDSVGNLYVGDTSNNTIRKITPSISGQQTNWVVTTVGGLAGSFGSADGTNSGARFNGPVGVAVDSAGNLYVADSENNTIRMGSPPPPTGSPVSVLAYYPFNTNGIPGSGTAAFTNNYLETATIGSNLSAFSNYNVGTNVSFVAGTTQSAVSNAPAGNAVSDGNWVGNTNYFQFTFNATGFQPLTVNYDLSRSITGPQTNQFQYSADGGVSFTILTNYPHIGGGGFQPFGNDVSGIDSLINNPNVVFRIVGAGQLSSSGTMSVDNFTISGIAAGPSYNFTTLAGSAGSQGTNDGTASNARFDFPQSAAVDSAGNVYVADTDNSTIRKVTPGGVVTTLAGLAGDDGNANGTNSSAQFSFPEGVAVDGAGNLYVGDTGNAAIRKITPTISGQQTNWVVTTLATGLQPEGIAMDSAGNIYVADTINSEIRRVSQSGVVTTLAGNGAGSADGTNSSARFDFPEGVAVDGLGNIYVADSGNNTIRMVAPSIVGQQTNWVVTTIAGLSGVSGHADGMGPNSRLNFPEGVTADSAGNLYVADTQNTTIRKITPTISGQQTNWVVTTLGGIAINAGSVNGTGSNARFDFPSGVAVDNAGNLYVADKNNNTIRKGSPFLGINPGVDIGLRIYDGTGIIKIGAQSGAPTSPLRINKNGTSYSVVLVPTNSTTASRIRIQTSEGTRSLEKLP